MKQKDEIPDLEKRLGVGFDNPDLLKEALTHRSYVNENPKWKHGNNERLEFLGDAVLELVVTDELFKRFPNKEEGELTIYRAALVNTRVLARAAQNIGLDSVILMSKGEFQGFSGRARESISADAVEAVIGALYLDKGYKTAKDFIERNIIKHIDEALQNGGKDPKSRVQEIAQSKHKITPTYEVLEEFGPAHEREFHVGLYFGDELKSKGIGKSKQEAETEAAQAFLDKNIG